MLSISALFVAVLGDEDLRNMMFGAIQTPEDFDAWAQYIFDFEELPDTVADNSHPVLDFFVKPVNAKVIDDFVIVLRKVLDETILRGVTTTAGKLGETAIIAIKRARDVEVENIDLKNLKYTEEFYHAATRVFAHAGEDGLRGLMFAYNPKTL